MGLILNGNAPSKMLYNGAEVSLYFNGSKIWPTKANLPPYTLRLRFADGVIPTNSKGTLTQVSSSPNVWDWTYDGSWWQAWEKYDTLLEVIDGNTSNVTAMAYLFNGCTSLTSVPLFDTSSVTNMAYLFNDCTSLTSVPLFDTSKVSNTYNMLNNCYKVASGALALYQQVSSQTTQPYHYQMFRNCGRDTITGAAELAQIPSGWK
jgi:surface protein